MTPSGFVEVEGGRLFHEVSGGEGPGVELTMDESGEIRLDPPAIERLEQIRAPTLVLPADRDPLWLRRASRLLAERIPGARVVEIADTDHVLNMRRPAAFDDAVLAFLNEGL